MRVPYAPVAFLLVLLPVAAFSQGPIQRLGQGLDNMGKNIRRTVDEEIDRGQGIPAERSVVNRVYHRIHWDTALINSNLQFVVQADGSVILRGTVGDIAIKNRAIDLARTTVGVTAVVDELVIGKPGVAPVLKPAAIMIEAKPAIVVTPDLVPSGPVKP